MANNKIQLADGTVLIDLTDTTATADTILQGYGAYAANGEWVDGTAVAGAGSAVTVIDEPDGHGGTIRHINAVSLAGDTVRANVLLQGYTAHNALGELVVGTASGGGTPTLQSKSVTPTESSQTIIADAGYDGLSDVEISAIPSTYVGSAIDRNDSTDLSASGATVTAPAGYYADSASASVASGTATAPTSISGTAASVSTGTNTLTLSKTVSVTPRITTAGYISSGTAGNSSVSLTASITTKAAATITPTKSAQTIASGTYLTGTQTIAAIPSEYIVTTDATASAADINSGATAYVNGSKVTGTQVIQTYRTGSSVPSSSLGNNGDLYLQVVS